MDEITTQRTAGKESADNRDGDDWNNENAQEQDDLTAVIARPGKTPGKPSPAGFIVIGGWRPQVAQSRQAQTEPRNGLAAVAVARLEFRGVDDANLRTERIRLQLGRVAGAERRRTVHRYAKTARRLVEQMDRPSRSVRKHQFTLHGITDSESVGLAPLVLGLLCVHDRLIRFGDAGNTRRENIARKRPVIRRRRPRGLSRRKSTSGRSRTTTVGGRHAGSIGGCRDPAHLSRIQTTNRPPRLARA